MKTTKVMASEQSIDKFDGDLLVYSVCEPVNGENSIKCDPIVEKEVINAYQLGDFSGKEGQTLLLYPNESQQSVILSKRVLVVGVGRLVDKLGKIDIYNLREQFRKAGGTIALISEKVKAQKIMISVPNFEDVLLNNLTSADIAECLAEGILLGDYRFLKYKKEKKDEPDYKGLSEVKFYLEKGSKTTISLIRKAIKLGFVSAQSACQARDMANEPGNGWRASDFASYAQDLANKYNFKCTVIDKEKMVELKMGGILAVNQGSNEPPKMVILEYMPKLPKRFGDTKNIDTILFVGKGITFDSGGICLKQPSGMENMKYDMCGGAATLALMQAVGQESPENISVVAIVPATDNLTGGSAMKPGDIICHYNGITSEIVNTDAEGRLILADALAYGVETFKPVCVVDIATLTGAVIMGLGHHYSAVLGNNDKLINQLQEAAKRAGEPLWQLPLGKDYTKQIESKVADIKNTGGKSAGTITAAAYLEKFVKDTPWAHIDIAGTAWEFTEKSYIPKGASGIGTRTFLEFIRSWNW
ncbi:MAG: leucyl aminopeptidase [Desulfamplus sp.]|nr:leucyl aminopeptidase [Desulfamplus sp.]